MTSAGVHDSQVFDCLIDEENTSRAVWADSAYRSRSAEAWLEEEGYCSHIHTKSQLGNPLSKAQRRANKKQSSVRIRVKYVFASHKREHLKIRIQHGLVIITR